MGRTQKFAAERAISVVAYGAIVSWMFLAGAMPSRAETGIPVKVFRCQGENGTVFSDRPCSNTEQSTEVLVPSSNSYHEEPLPHSRSATRSAIRYAQPRQRTSAKGDSIASEQVREKQRCQRLADQLEAIRNKMRAGYTVRQGQKLDERQRELEQRRKTERCR